jgi:hypothetical protein
VLWFWIFVGPAVILALVALRGERNRAGLVAARMAALAGPPATRPAPLSLIVPVTDAGDGLRETLRALAAQDHGDYELIIAVRDAEAIPAGALPAPLKVALSGEADRLSLLLAGLRAARQQSQVIAFARPDGVVSPFWLRALAAPLQDPETGASSGFRCYTPQPPAFWPLLRSVWNSVIAERLGPGRPGVVWEGAAAIHKEVLLEARAADCWFQATRDDLALSAALRKAGRRIVFAPGAIVAYGDRPTACGFLAQACREMSDVRAYLPGLWWRALTAHVLYCGAMLASVIAIARGSRGAEWALVVLFGLGMLKGANRATLAKAQLPQYSTWFDRYGWTHTFWLPLATWIWLAVLIASLACGRRRNV